MASRSLPYTLILLLAFLFPITLAARAEDSNDNWDAAFGPPGVNGEVNVMTVVGDNIYVGGSFIRAGSISANHIARWNTTTHQWFPLGDGVDGTVMAIAVRGDTVYIGGQFNSAGSITTRNMARYITATNSWSTWGGPGAGGGSFGYVGAIAIKGEEIYAAGNFTTIGTTLANNIARWDGVKWYRIDAGLNSDVYTLLVNGNDLYVGGNFTTAGLADAKYLARWNGTAWSALGGGTNGPVHALTVDADKLYVGGRFTSVGSVSASNIARFSITTNTWSALGTGVAHPDVTQKPVVNSIAVSGNDIYIGGSFRRAGPDVNITRHVARWDGTDWTSRFIPSESAGKGIGSEHFSYAIVNAVIILNGEAYFGGRFDYGYMQVNPPNPHDDGVSQPYAAFNIVRWSISRLIWHSLGDAANDLVLAAAVIGRDIYIGGHFTTAGGVVANSIARWSSLTRRWSALDSGFGKRSTTVTALATSGNDLYAAVTSAEVLEPANNFECYVAHWNSSTGKWTTLGGRFSTFAISVLAVRGDTIYAGGKDTGAYAGGVARWDGTAWSAIDAGNVKTISAIAINGSSIYVGGVFAKAGNVSANNIARWDESTGGWSALGSGLDAQVNAIAINGDDLYAGGTFTSAGNIEANHIAQWSENSSSWSPLGDGLSGGLPANVTVNAIAALNGRIYVGGAFATAGDISAMNIAEWDGEIWDALGTGTNGTVGALAGNPTQLISVGRFTLAGDRLYHTARWADATASLAVEASKQESFMLEQNIPNPFTSVTKIRFAVSSGDKTFHTFSRSDGTAVRLSIYDALGNPVATLIDGEVMPGEQSIQWDASDVPSGVYYYRLQYGSHIETREMLLER